MVLPGGLQSGNPQHPSSSGCGVLGAHLHHLLKVKTQHTQGYLCLSPRALYSQGCPQGNRLTGQKSTLVTKKMENQTTEKSEADLLEQMGPALK